MNMLQIELAFVSYLRTVFFFLILLLVGLYSCPNIFHKVNHSFLFFFSFISLVTDMARRLKRRLKNINDHRANKRPSRE